jgi:DNA sulfur modification protein DndC
MELLLADRRSAFADISPAKALQADIRELYRADAFPWVVGYSGGKDSTATLQLVWLALADLDPAERTKPVHVISTDTLVENPIVAAWVAKSLDAMRAAAEHSGMPIHPHRLTPAVADTFWVNLIGKGYAAPRPKFRWCTERMKIKPSNAFINTIARENGEAIVVLGTRKAESQARARSMGKLEKLRVRDKLSPNSNLPNSLVYSPIETWSNRDVWIYLQQVKNPWGHDNRHLLTLYRGASPDGECPLVVDESTPSCGSSRFGCWVCTMVEQDKSMAAMIDNDEEKEWMLPLLELRNELDVADDRDLRDFRRLSGLIQIHNGRLVHGPYKQEARERWLRRLFEAQRHVRERGPEDVRDIQLITLPELAEIRRIWVVEKHEIEDRLPVIYEEMLGQPYPGPAVEENGLFGEGETTLLREACGGDELRFQRVRDLLAVERRYRAMARRAGLYGELEKTLLRNSYASEEEAEQVALDRQRQHDAIDQAHAHGDHALMAPETIERFAR